MTKIVDGAEAIKLLENARDEKGADYVYTDHYGTCELAADGEPRCIVGHVYAALGIPVEELESIYGPVGNENNYEAGIERSLDFEREYGIRFTGDAKRILHTAQYRQDNGKTWGESVEIAVREWAEAEEES